MKYFKRILLSLTAVSLLFSLFSVNVLANRRETAFTLLYHDNGKALAGAEFSLYFVAEENSNGGFDVSEPFNHYNIKITSEEDGMRALASTLEGYVLKDGIMPVEAGEINDMGSLTFPVGNAPLKNGIYLVLGERHFANGMVYDASPFMIRLSGGNITVEVKYSVFDSKNLGSYISTLRVLKVWADEKDGKTPPTDITVQLLKDGKVYGTAVLNKENNWRYDWFNLPQSSRWSVVELVPDGYTATVVREGNTFVVTNTLKQEDNKPSDSASESSSSSSSSSSSQSKPTLPQTGVLWWPVPLSAVAGIGFLIFGILSKKNESND